MYQGKNKMCQDMHKYAKSCIKCGNVRTQCAYVSIKCANESINVPKCV